MVQARESLHDKEFIQQTFLEEAIVQSSDEGTQVLQHLNAFNRILSYLLALAVKLEEEDKSLLLCLLFLQVMITWRPPSYMKKKP